MLNKFQKNALNSDIAQLKGRIDVVERCELSIDEKFGRVSAYYFFIVNGYSCTESASKMTLKDLQPLTNLLNAYFDKLYGETN